MIVVDTQMLVYLAMGGPNANLAKAASVRDDEWVTVPLWRSEFRNVLAGMIRRGELDVAAALAGMDRAWAALTHELEFDGDRVMELVALSKCSAYDLEFVVLAEALGVPLVTNNRQVLDAFPMIAVRAEAFAG